jgi:hypothetical protein
MLEQLPAAVERKVNRRAVTLATSPILSACRAECPVDKGDLQKSLIKKITNAGKRSDGIVGADAAYVSADGTLPSNIDHLVHYGHVTPGGRVVEPNPFLQRGWDASIAQARAKYETVLAEGVEEEALKLGGG